MSDKKGKQAVFGLPNEPIVPTVPMPQPQPQEMSIEQALALAGQHQQSGNPQEAEKLLRQILQVQPGQPQALHLLGVLAHMVGNLPLAIQCVEQAIQSDENIALFHTNLGEMYRLHKNVAQAIFYGQKAVKLDSKMVSGHGNLGIAYYDNKEFDKAEECQKRALALNSDFVPALNNMGSLMREKGGQDSKERAVEYYRKALAVHPDYIESMNNIGATLTQLEKHKEALGFLNRALAINPDYADAHCNKGFAHLGLEQEGLAHVSFMAALNIRPDYAEAYVGIARLKHENHELEEAKEAVMKALELNAELAEAHSVLGSVYAAQGETDKAERAYNTALERDDKLTSARLGIGHILMERGNISEAEEMFRDIVNTKEEKIGALFSLVQSKKMKAGDKEIEILEKEAEKLDALPESKQAYVNFALGKIYDDLKEPNKAFPRFIEGCRLKRKKLDYDAALKDQEFEHIKKVFNKDYINRLRGHGCLSDTPIFVLGMPRSGTTLTEQIIASHPNVFGAGELFDMLDATQAHGKKKGEKFPENLEGLTPENLKTMGQSYVDGLKARDSEAQKITDKMPANFFNMGFIHLALPNAKIVHIQRHPLDNCISCFTRLFTHNQNQTYNLYELGRFYAAYKNLMDYWRKTLPQGSFYDIHYEDLVTDTEEQARALIDYCGLDWDESCLEFYKTKRNIRTASVTQVRQPIYKTSVARWKRYEKFLGPLIEGLGEALDGEKT